MLSLLWSFPGSPQVLHQQQVPPFLTLAPDLFDTDTFSTNENVGRIIHPGEKLILEQVLQTQGIWLR